MNSARFERADSSFVAGFVAMLPLWVGVLPFALTYAVSARGSGLSVWETQAMSLFVFAGASQISAAGMFAAGAGGLAIIATTFLINVRHALYGLNLGRRIPRGGLAQVLAAHTLTDEAFGIVSARKPTLRFLLGTELSLFFIWNLGTLAGALLSSSLPDPVTLGVDFIFPLAFLVLLLPLLVSRPAWLVAGFSGLLAWLLSGVVNAGLLVLVTGVAGSLFGAWLLGSRDEASA